MNHRAGDRSRMIRIICRSTRSHFLAYSLIGMSVPVLSSLRLWWLMAATENVVQSGLAHITSGCPNLLTTFAAVTLSTSTCQSASIPSSHSTQYVSCPLLSNALLIDLVPLKSSRTLSGL